MKRHPHSSTLELMRLAIKDLPMAFSSERRRVYRGKLELFQARPETPYDEIHKVIADLGRDSWAYRRAFADIYARYGRPSEESHVLDSLDAGVREKYERFLHEGGKINYIESAKSSEEMHKPSPFENYFSPEEKFAINESLIDARIKAREEIEELVADAKKEEYRALVEKYEAEKKKIEGELEQLRRLSTVSKKWKPGIDARLRTLEEGWSVIGPQISLTEASAELDYWRGMLEAFLG